MAYINFACVKLTKVITLSAGPCSGFGLVFNGNSKANRYGVPLIKPLYFKHRWTLDLRRDWTNGIRLRYVGICPINKAGATWPLSNYTPHAIDPE